MTTLHSSTTTTDHLHYRFTLKRVRINRARWVPTSIRLNPSIDKNNFLRNENFYVTANEYTWYTPTHPRCTYRFRDDQFLISTPDIRGSANVTASMIMMYAYLRRENDYRIRWNKRESSVFQLHDGSQHKMTSHSWWWRLSFFLLLLMLCSILHYSIFPNRTNMLKYTLVLVFLVRCILQKDVRR